MEEINFIKKKFWKNKKVLITGHSGFKGSWLVLILKYFGARVYGYSLKPDQISLFKLTSIEKILDGNKYGDINNCKYLKDYMNFIKPEIVIHLAAQPLVIDSFKNPFNTLYTNVNGTINLLNVSSKIKSIKIVLNVTTDKVYKVSNKLKLYKEDDPLCGSEIYSISKSSSDQITQVFSNLYSTKQKKFFVARSGNVIGGGDFSANRIVPDILNSYNSNNTLSIRNDSHIRPWQHVIEPLSGYLLIIEKFYNQNIKNNNEISWNFGPNKDSYLSVRDLVNIFKSNIDFKFKSNNISSQKIESAYVGLNSNKAKKELNWKTIWPLNKTVKMIINWNDAFLLKKDLRKLSIQQIDEYFNNI